MDSWTRGVISCCRLYNVSEKLVKNETDSTFDEPNAIGVLSPQVLIISRFETVGGANWRNFFAFRIFVLLYRPWFASVLKFQLDVQSASGQVVIVNCVLYIVNYLVAL